MPFRIFTLRGNQTGKAKRVISWCFFCIVLNNTVLTLLLNR